MIENTGKETHRYELPALVMFVNISKEVGRADLSGNLIACPLHLILLQ